MKTKSKGKNVAEQKTSSHREERLVRHSWRKEQARYGPETYRLSRGGEELAVAQKNKAGSWFWYGGGRNTCATPTDLETAKKDAKAYILSLPNAQNPPTQIP